jgi:hypothetical protein
LATVLQSISGGERVRRPGTLDPLRIGVRVRVEELSELSVLQFELIDLEFELGDAGGEGPVLDPGRAESPRHLGEGLLGLLTLLRHGCGVRLERVDGLARGGGQVRQCLGLDRDRERGGERSDRDACRSECHGEGTRPGRGRESIEREGSGPGSTAASMLTVHPWGRSAGCGASG